MEARDLAAVVDAFAADAVFRSPLTTRLAFTGHEQIGALLQVLFEVLQDLQFGPDGKIGEFTVFFRPLPAAALALRLIAAGPGPPQESRPGRRRLRPDSLLGIMTRAGDPIGVRLVRSAL
jgi:hypothetical protein